MPWTDSWTNAQMLPLSDYFAAFTIVQTLMLHKYPMYRRIIQLISLFLLWTLLVTSHNVHLGEMTKDMFFSNPRFGGSYTKTLPLTLPNSVVAHIRAEVPHKWQVIACESAFFHIPTDFPDTILLKHLDVYDAAFPADSMRAFTQLMRGSLFINQLEYDTAAVCLQEAYDLSLKAHNLTRAGDAKLYMGRMALNRSDYPKGIRLLLETYDIYRPLVPGDGGRYFEVLLNLGKAYQSSHDYLSARKWFQTAWQYALKYNSKGFKIQLATALAENYLEVNQLDSAQIMIDTAFYLERQAQNFYQQSERYRILAQIQVALGNCTAALPNLWKAHRLNTDLDKPKIVSIYNKALADGYHCANRLDSAIFFYKQALMTPDTAAQAVIHKQLADIYAQQGKHQEAFKHDRESFDLSNRTFTSDKYKAVAELQIQNETEQRILRIENQDHITRLWFIVGLLVLGFVLVVSIFWSNRERQRQRLLVKEKELIATREQLKTQILLSQAEIKLTKQERALRESEKLLDIKNLFIEELEMKLAQHDTPQYEPQELADNTFVEMPLLSNMRILTTADWLRFRKLFDARFPDFGRAVKTSIPHLTASDMRLMLLIKTGFSPTETAHILGITLESVYKSRYRLRQKVGLVGDDDLDGFVLTF